MAKALISHEELENRITDTIRDLDCLREVYLVQAEKAECNVWDLKNLDGQILIQGHIFATAQALHALALARSASSSVVNIYNGNSPAET